MDEILEIYDLDNNLISKQNRKNFYNDVKKEFLENGSVSKKVKTVHILLMNSLGRIYLQKRSSLKKENANMYDKTVGGHVTSSNSFELTVVKECAEELGFPSTIVSEDEFKNAINSIDLKIIGILKKIDYLPNFMSKRILEGGTNFIQPYMTEIYIGYYDGPIRFADGESSGIETFSLKEIQKEIEENPNKFTEDIKYMVENYSNILLPITK